MADNNRFVVIVCVWLEASHRSVARLRRGRAHPGGDRRQSALARRPMGARRPRRRRQGRWVHEPGRSLACCRRGNDFAGVRRRARRYYRPRHALDGKADVSSRHQAREHRGELPFVGGGTSRTPTRRRTTVPMALATVRAETEGFLPIDEGSSRFNTRNTPFDLYDAGDADRRQTLLKHRARPRPALQRARLHTI